MNKKKDKGCEGCKKYSRGPMEFPVAFTGLGDKEMIKVITDKGSVVMSNDVVVDYLYQQMEEGSKTVKFQTPDGKRFDRIFPTKNLPPEELAQHRADKINERIKNNKPKLDFRDESVPELDERGYPMNPIRRNTTIRIK